MPIHLPCVTIARFMQYCFGNRLTQTYKRNLLRESVIMAEHAPHGGSPTLARLLGVLKLRAVVAH